MAPPQKAASQASTTRSASAESADTQQSGRSPSALSAERAAAALHRSSASDLSPASSPTQLPGKIPLPLQTSSSSPSPSPSIGLPSLLHPPTHKPPHTSHVPQISSPLSAKSSSDSIGRKPQDNSDQRRTSQGSNSSSDPATASRQHQPLPRPLWRGPVRPPGLDLGPRHSTSTLTLQDLGSDYTRYFNPFSDSARNSYSDAPSRPVSRYSSHGNSRSTTHLLVAPPVNPFITPNASATNLSSEHDPEKQGALINDRLNAPYNEKEALSWPLFTDAPEDDDEMHMPHPDDDLKYKPKLKDHFSSESIVSTMGLLFMVVGLLFVFVGLPVLSFEGILVYSSSYSTPLDQMPSWPQGEAWAIVNKSRTWPLLKNMRTSLIDRDTPQSAMTKIGAFGEEFELVFSDEFNVPNRTFYEGDDPFWFAPDIWYGATQDLEWYDPDAVTTWDGTLELRLDKFINHGLNFRSGMLNSWNHLCFKGGIFEVSVSLPGPAAVMGLWPGVWTMGNLGRPGYLSTTEGMWPYTYQECDVGITPNQSSSDGLSRLPGQRLPSCTCPGEDHPTPGTGRGASEIDVLEAGASYGGLPIATQSFQVAPFDLWWYPNYNFTAFPDYSIAYTNGYTGGPFQQAVSATTNLNKQWYDGKQYQTYSFEYVPGEGEDSYIVWKVGGQTTFMIDGRAIGPNGNIQARQISEEPMSMILNLGISNSWTAIDWANLVFPTVMRIDHVRWYQKKDQKTVTCDPPGFETTKYIKDHIVAYTNPNLTKWDETGYKWPKHKLNSQC